MAFEHSLNYTYNSTGDTVSGSIRASGEQEIKADITVPEGAEDLKLGSIQVDASKCRSLCIVADAEMTLETNSSTAPAQTFNLLPRVPVVWVVGDGPCPITADIKQAYVSSKAGGTLKFRALIGSTT